MLTNQLDFMSYATALKSNYRKGIRRLEAILSNPTHAAEFAANLGGVSVVLGVPIGREDRNSDALLSLLLNSDIADDAVLTWMHQFYEFTTWDDLMGNSARVQEMMQNPFLWRALGGSKKAVGKGVATLAGLSCASYTDIDAVVSSSTAMAAVAASQTAMAAIQKSQAAKDAIAASSMATAKYAAGAAGLNPADYADMTVLAASSTAMTAVATSQTAMAAVIGNATALNAVVSSSTAMAAVATSQTAMAAVAASQTAMAAVATSQTAMAAVATSKVATGAIAASATALAKIAGSTTALDALYAKKSRLTGASASKSGKFIILQISSSSAFSTSQYGYATLSDGSQPDWGSYLGKYAYFKQFKMVATFIKNDTESDDWIDYFPCG